MKKSGIFLISILAISSMMLLAATAPTAQAQDDNVITITAEAGAGNKYDKTSIDLEVGVEYTIVFVNEQVETGHNLRIDVNDNLEDNGNVDDSGDVVIGPENNQAGNSTVGSWNATVTFDEDSEIIFYCGFTGHYDQGMFGTFIVGEGDSPGFGLFFAFSALLLVAVAVPRIRKNQR